MQNILEIAAPLHFNFENTVLRLRRGNIDPINKWDEDKKQWRRLLLENDKHALVNIYQLPKNRTIFIKKLSGNLKNELIQEKIIKLLGFDDPFLKKPHNKFVKYPELQKSWSIALPGYGNLFEAFVQIILGQLVSTHVTNLLLSRFIQQFGISMTIGEEVFYHFPTFTQFNNKKMIDSIKSIGLSEAKAHAIYEIAVKFQDRDWLDYLLNPSICWSQKYAKLIEIKGIGAWSANWFLFRGLRQFQIIPITDLAVRKALSWWWKSPITLSPAIISKNLLTMNCAENLKGLLVYKIMCAFFSIDKLVAVKVN